MADADFIKNLPNYFRRRFPAGGHGIIEKRIRAGFDLVFDALDRLRGLQRLGPWEDKVYYDLRPIEVHRQQGVGAPDVEALTENFYAPAFDQTTPERQTFVFHISHRFALGTTPTFHIHTTHNIASPTGAGVRWNTTWYYAKGYGAGAFATTGTVVSGTQNPGAQFVHEIYGEDPDGLADVFVCPSGIVPLIEPDGLIVVVLERDATHVDDDWDHDFFVITADLHVQHERDGTTERNRPFTSGGFTP